MYKVLYSFSVSQLIISYLYQVETLPSGLINILSQLPFVAVIVWLWLQNDKARREDREKDRLWLEHMLETQRRGIKESYDSNNATLLSFISHIGEQEKEIAGELKLLAQQIAVNTSTINEVAKVDAIVSDLIDRLEKK